MAMLLTAAQMRAVEGNAIQSGAVSGLQLMERAGKGVVAAIFEEWPELKLTSHKAVVLCGPGNNGGDGFVIARLLKDWGWEVEVFLYGDPAKLPPDAKTNYERWTGETKPLEAYSASFPGLQCDIAIDAAFGTGLARPIEDKQVLRFLTEMEEATRFGAMARAGVKVKGVPFRTVAVDIPSGLCADSGRVLGGDHPWLQYVHCAPVDLTVSFHAEKLGHRLAAGPRHCGRVVVADIGLGELSATKLKFALIKAGMEISEVKKATRIAQMNGPRESLGDQGKPPFDHKYTHGHALIFSGSMGRSGAARLAARGALRIGAGLVTVVAPGSAMMECAAQLTAVMLRKCDDADALAALLEDARLNALCLGPGLGVDRARDMVPVALKARRNTVLDADALTTFADDPDALFAMLHKGCVLTPHAGEFARLFPDLAAKLDEIPSKGPAYSKIDATREAAARAGCTVLFKGPDTVIADETGAALVNSSAYDRAAPWLATAGSGDVLAGFITGLLARGQHPLMAASNGAWLHTECARSFGPGLIAEDLPEHLPHVLRQLAPGS